MRFLYEHWLWLWGWLTEQGVARATVILVFITACYAYLTYRMSKAMNRQTCALVQPILKIKFTINEEEFYPKGSFSVNNLGTQPILIRYMQLKCHREGVEEHKEYSMYERHLLTPSEMIGFDFDFTEPFKKRGFTWWTPGICAFNLWVVASDLGGEVVLTYIGNHAWETLRVSRGMPWLVRRKLVVARFRRKYNRILYKLHPPKLLLTPDDSQVLNTQREESQVEINFYPGSDSSGKQ